MVFGISFPLFCISSPDSSISFYDYIRKKKISLSEPVRKCQWMVLLNIWKLYRVRKTVQNNFTKKIAIYSSK